MKHIRLLAQYYVDLLVKLGLIRFSLLLASALVVLAMIVQMAVTLLLHGHVESIDVVRSVFFGLLITPWAVYFLSVVVDQLEESRRRLALLVDKLEEMRGRDLQLNQQMHTSISQLNQEINERKNAEQARERAISKLQDEMTGRAKAQIELEQQSSFLRSFLDASPDLVFYRNIDRQFSGCNRAMELLTGKSEQQLVGLTPRDVYEPEVAAKVLETDEKVFLHNIAVTYEQWLHYPDGKPACFEIRKVPYYDRIGKRNGLMGFGRDITERKRYQLALENASRDKTTFISTISHELRTPLNGIVGLSRILLDTRLNKEQLNYLNTIHVSAITLGNIFNDVIEMDKIERLNVKLDNQPINFTDFITDIENLAGLLVQPKGLIFTMKVDSWLPQTVLADGTRLRQILWNLLSNAVKFTRQGRIAIHVAYQDQHLKFAVQDSGIGIPLAEQSKIFAMYYQVEGQHGGKPATGTGIGLAISARLAEAMGGSIKVQSEPGQGACFKLDVLAPEILMADSTAQSAEQYPLPALHILLVEDIELNVVVACSVLEKLGCSTEVAMTGQQALDMFDPDEFDMVLLDIQLPDMTGLEVATELKQRFAGRYIPPLIALTANVLKDKSVYLAAGLDDVLSKPLAVPALTATIQQFWGRPESLQVEPQAETTVNHCWDQLDLVMLEEYLSLVGAQLIKDGLAMFEKMLPEYLEVLDSTMLARDQAEIVEQAHKIKGAAGAIGLKHLQKLAQKIQSPDLPAWWDNVEEWIDELHFSWKSDVETLHRWLASQKTTGKSER